MLVVGAHFAHHTCLTPVGGGREQMEQSLQAIDERIALPYWDHTIDAKYFENDWPSSEIWSEEWFGASK